MSEWWGSALVWAAIVGVVVWLVIAGGVDWSDSDEHPTGVERESYAPSYSPPEPPPGYVPDYIPPRGYSGDTPFCDPPPYPEGCDQCCADGPSSWYGYDPDCSMTCMEVCGWYCGWE